MDTKNNLGAKLEELFELLPLRQAMGSLGAHGSLATQACTLLVESIQAPPEILAGLWLYVDELDRSHSLSQNIASPTGSYWHAIMHRREGDFSNAKYWLRSVGEHPVIRELGYDPIAFTDDCRADRGLNSPTLVEMQRREWKTLFEWCVQEIENA